MKNRTSGMTVLELMMAVVILTVALIPIMSGLRMLRGALEERIIENKLILYGQSLMDEIRSKKWDEDSNPFTLFSSTPTISAALGPEENPPLFNDVDDYLYYQTHPDHPEPGITRTATIKYVALPDDPINGGMVDSGVATKYKFIRVTVSFNKAKSITKTFENILANTP